MIPGSISYLGPVEDPVFAAHRPSDTEETIGRLYYFDRIASVMGCADQHQICNANPPLASQSDEASLRCTPFQSASQLMTTNITASGIGLTDLQRNISYTVQSSLLRTDMSFSVSGRDSEALLASRTVFDGVNIQLPSNQWTKEVGHWFSIGLVRLQFALLEYATGPAGVGNNNDEEELTKFNGSSLQKMYENTCLLQKVGQFNSQEGGGGDYLTFHVLGLALIIAVGGFIFVLGVALEFLIEHLPKHGWGAERRGAWVSQDRFAVWNKLRGHGY